MIQSYFPAIVTTRNYKNCENCETDKSIYCHMWEAVTRKPLIFLLEKRTKSKNSPFPLCSLTFLINLLQDSLLDELLSALASGHFPLQHCRRTEDMTSNKHQYSERLLVLRNVSAVARLFGLHHCCCPVRILWLNVRLCPGFTTSQLFHTERVTPTGEHITCARLSTAVWMIGVLSIHTHMCVISEEQSVAMDHI